MLVALATHNGDRYLSVPLANHIRNTGGVREHELLIVSPVGTNLTGIEDVFRDAFGRVHVHLYNESMRGWPWGANEAAFEVFQKVFVTPEFPSHFLMMEPDCVPVGSYWLNEIDMAYRRCGMPVMGVTIPTTELSGEPTGQRHTVGVAVYPKDFPRYCSLLKSLVKMTRAYQQANHLAPWDVMFAPYVAKMTAQTNLIQHLVRRFTADEKGLRWDCPSLEDALAQVRQGAVLIHGSKNPEFLIKLTGGKPHAAEERKGPDRVEHSRVLERPNVQENPAQARESDRKEGGDSRVDQRQQEEVVLTKEQRKEKRMRENAELRRIKNHTALRKEFGIEFEIDTPEFARAIAICIDIGQGASWQETKAYARELGLTVSSKWKKGDLACEITKAEKEQRKTDKWKAKPSYPPPPPAPLEIDPSVKAEAYSPQSHSLERETAIPGGAMAQIFPAGAAKAGSRMIPPSNGMSHDRVQQMMQLRAQRQGAGLPV